MTFYLPQADAKAVFESAVPEAKKTRRSLHVMVVDDESMICDFVKEFLVSEGYRSTTFTNPQKRWTGTGNRMPMSIASLWT